jgi:hypothetical protein
MGAELGMTSGSTGAGQYTTGGDEGNDVEVTVQESKSSYDSYYFPHDIQQAKFFPEQMKFTVYERQGISLEKMKKTIVGGFNKFAGSAEAGKQAAQTLKEKKKAYDVLVDQNKGKKLENRVDTTAALNALEQARTESSKYTSGAAVVDTGKKVMGNIQEGITARQQMNSKAKDKIYLPMAEVSFADSVSWASSDLGGIGAVLKGDLTGAGAATALAMGATGMATAGGSIIGKILGSGAGGAIAGFMASDSLQKGIESSVGIKANPYKEQTFEGIDFRKFSFTYKFNPRSQDDTNTLNSIISIFRAYSKPSFRAGGGIFNYPHEFHIEFLTYSAINDSFDSNPNIPQLKYCICTNVATNFATKEWRSFENGAPVEITLQLDFEETELVTQNDVLGKTSVGRFKQSKGRRF